MSSIEAIAFYLTNRAEIVAYLATEVFEAATCNQDISQPKLLATQTSDTSLERGKQMAASLGL